MVLAATISLSPIRKPQIPHLLQSRLISWSRQYAVIKNLCMSYYQFGFHTKRQPAKNYTWDNTVSFQYSGNCMLLSSLPAYQLCLNKSVVWLLWLFNHSVQKRQELWCIQYLRCSQGPERRTIWIACHLNIKWQTRKYICNIYLHNSKSVNIFKY
jgi:hypothetical protein